MCLKMFAILRLSGHDDVFTHGEASRRKEDHVPLRRRQDAATLLIALEDDAMHVTAGWTVGVATMLLMLGTPQVSRPEATLSFSSRYDYCCWNPGAQGHACSQRSSTKIWTSSPVPVEVE